MEYYVLESEMKNPFGLHCRPSQMFVGVASKYPNDIFLVNKDKEANGKSVIGLLTLAIEHGEKVAIKVSREGDYERIAKELEEIFSIEYRR